MKLVNSRLKETTGLTTQVLANKSLEKNMGRTEGEKIYTVVALNLGWLCLVDIWQGLETFLVVTTGVGVLLAFGG